MVVGYCKTTRETLLNASRRSSERSRNGLTADQIAELNEKRRALRGSSSHRTGYRSGLGGMTKPPVARVLLNPVTSQTSAEDVAELRELLDPQTIEIRLGREDYTSRRRPPAPVYA